MASLFEDDPLVGITMDHIRTGTMGVKGLRFLVRGGFDRTQNTSIIPLIEEEKQRAVSFV
jgi:hypothetical protein